jgi:hypothetical protein
MYRDDGERETTIWVRPAAIAIPRFVAGPIPAINKTVTATDPISGESDEGNDAPPYSVVEVVDRYNVADGATLNSWCTPVRKPNWPFGNPCFVVGKTGIPAGKTGAVFDGSLGPIPLAYTGADPLPGHEMAILPRQWYTQCALAPSIATCLKVVQKPCDQWQPDHAYALHEVISSAPGNGFLYECDQGGTSGGTQPTWPTTENYDVTDGDTVVWRCVGRQANFGICMAEWHDIREPPPISGIAVGWTTPATTHITLTSVQVEKYVQGYASVCGTVSVFNPGSDPTGDGESAYALPAGMCVDDGRRVWAVWSARRGEYVAIYAPCGQGCPILGSS